MTLITSRFLFHSKVNHPKFRLHIASKKVTILVDHLNIILPLFYCLIIKTILSSWSWSRFVQTSAFVTVGGLIVNLSLQYVFLFFITFLLFTTERYWRATKRSYCFIGDVLILLFLLYLVLFAFYLVLFSFSFPQLLPGDFLTTFRPKHELQRGDKGKSLCCILPNAAPDDRGRVAPCCLASTHFVCLVPV